MRTVAKAALRLYPRAWRDRYGAEVADLIASRPARLRTVLDLLAGATDAWLNHRRIPDARPLRVPLPVVLTVAGVALLLLWDPAVREIAAHAPGTGRLYETAMLLFAVSGLTGVLSVAPLLFACYVAMRNPVYGQVTRATARRVIVTAPLPAVLVALLGYLSREDAAGGFLVPIILALVLPLLTIAADVPSLASEVSNSGKSLAVAAICNALGWLCTAAVLVVGRPEASWAFVAGGALISVGMSVLVARSALRLGRAAFEPTGQLQGAHVSDAPTHRGCV